MAKAILSWDLTIDCPKCKEIVYLSDHDEDGVFSQYIFNNDWDNLKGADVKCLKCGHEFEIDGVEY